MQIHDTEATPARLSAGRDYIDRIFWAHAERAKNQRPVVRLPEKERIARINEIITTYHVLNNQYYHLPSLS